MPRPKPPAIRTAANQLRRDNVQRLLALASAQRAQRDLDSATATYRRILTLQPRNFAALVNLGIVLNESGQSDEAEVLYARAIAVDPTLPEPHYNLGEIHRQSNRLEMALADFDAALALRPGYVKAAFSRLLTLQALKRFDDAKTACARVLELDPDHIGGLYQQLKMSQHGADFRTSAQAHRRLAQIVPRLLAQTTSRGIVANLAYIQLFSPWDKAIARAVTDRLGELLVGHYRRHVLTPERPRPPAGRRLRIGYLSPNWGNHPVGHVTRSFFRRHDRSKFEIFGYATKDRSRDHGIFHADLTKSFDHFIDLTGRLPHQAARQIADDRIDVAVDLDGFMDQVSTAILVHRPVPIQVFWLGHAGGLGLPFMDYLIADHRVVRDDEVSLYREAVVRVPGTYHPADLHAISATTPSRASEGLPERAIVFCAFNNPQKIDAEIFAAWLRILAAVPDSVLWLTNHVKHADPKPNLRQAAAQAGIDPARLIFARYRADKSIHLARHSCADLFLDTFVMNAATTALDALSARLPVLTRPGAEFGTRMAASFLVELGLEALICDSTETYVARAIELARSPEQRQALRRALGAAIDSGRLFDTTKLARALEQGFTMMVERAANGLSPAPFDVPAA